MTAFSFRKLMDIIKNTEKQIAAHTAENDMLPEGCGIVAGVSGGADSLCMLLALVSLYGKEHKICAVHVNHNIRTEAAEDEAYVKKICMERDIPFLSCSVDVAARAAGDGISSEEAGRRLRYEAFDDAVKRLAEGSFPGVAEKVPVSRICVAHTMDDNAETMLLNLFRGTGLKGLAGIPAMRGNVVRPLLVISREMTEGYLNAQGIPYCTDITNEGDDYTRNRIRHKLLPAAKECINERAMEHMNETSLQLSEAEDFISEVIAEKYTEMITEIDDGIYIRRKEFRELHPYIAKRLLLKAMERTCGRARDISSVHMNALYGLFSKGRGKRLDLPYFITASVKDRYVVLSVDTEKELGKNKMRSGGSKG